MAPFDRVWTQITRVLEQTPPPEKSHHMAKFTRVIATGNINLRLHTGAGHSWILLHGDSRDTSEVSWTVKDRVMRIDLGNGYPKHGRVEVELGTRHLVAIDYRGKGSITGKRLQSKQLDLSINNSGRTLLAGQLNLRHVDLGGSGTVHLKGGHNRHVQLNLHDSVRVKIVGVSNLEKVKMSGRSRLSVRWLKAHTFRIFLKDYARAQIAGTAKVAFINLREHTHFNGRYLRATEAFVKTYDDSEADIAVVKKQHTLASDRSDIYYYAAPEYRTDFMAESGSVLDMKAWEEY
ncbi:MAG: DUF2807 domain-containing protein [Gammaproteobacteria bacterium]|nr:DUF2807 domain-containing protein [Gammaproteobacteria bacterium]